MTRIRMLIVVVMAILAMNQGGPMPAAAHERSQTSSCGSGFKWHSTGGQITGGNPEIFRVDMHYNRQTNTFCGINRRVGPAHGSPGTTIVRLQDGRRASSAGGVRSHYAGPAHLNAGSDRCLRVGSTTVYGLTVEVAEPNSRTVCGGQPPR